MLKLTSGKAAEQNILLLMHAGLLRKPEIMKKKPPYASLIIENILFMSTISSCGMFLENRNPSTFVCPHMKLIHRAGCHNPGRA